MWYKSGPIRACRTPSFNEKAVCTSFEHLHEKEWAQIEAGGSVPNAA